MNAALVRADRQLSLSPRRGLPRLALRLSVLALLSLAAGCSGCVAPKSVEAGEKPSLRLLLLSDVAGAAEPCGCRADMLGGVDHAAAYLRSARSGIPSAVVAAGPLLFQDPELKAENSQQDRWKAELLAGALGDLGAIWSPAFNDFASGAPWLTELARSSKLVPLAANLELKGVEGLRVQQIGNHKVGFVGLSLPQRREAAPPGVALREPRVALEQARAELERQGAQVLVLTASMARGKLLRLVEQVPGFHVAVVGSPSLSGDTNDAPTPPVLVGQTLVVQTPNHLQGVASVDFYVKGGSYKFADAGGLAQAEAITSLDTRAADLRERIAAWEKSGSVSKQDLDARRADLARLATERQALTKVQAPTQGSYFRYELVEVREALGVDKAVSDRLLAFYKRTNEHNRVAFKDRLPRPAAAGEASYVGVDQCSTCHAPARKFWDGTAHARAYSTLEKGFKQFNLECVGCHVTGYERPGGSTVTQVDTLKNVQCEACHGPGSLHVQAPSKATIVAKPASTLCGDSCHHPPHVEKSWSFEASVPKILGPGHGRPLSTEKVAP